MAIKSRQIKKKSVIIDSSSAIILFKSSLFMSLLQYYTIYFADSVYHELSVNEYIGSQEVISLVKDKKINVVKTNIDEKNYTKEFYDKLLKLGSGERDTIKLFIDGTGDFIVIDDGKGVAFCREYSIPHINALLVPRIFLFSKLLNNEESDRAFNKILSIGRYSSFVIHFAENSTAIDLDKFIC